MRAYYWVPLYDNSATQDILMGEWITASALLLIIIRMLSLVVWPGNS